MSRSHDLKTWPEYFERVADNTKTFEIRRNDRGYRAGDELVLREYDPHQGEYTGRVERRRIGFVASGELVGLNLGEHVVLSLLPASPVAMSERAQP